MIADQDFRKYTLWLLGIIVILLVVFVGAILYLTITWNQTRVKVDNVLDDAQQGISQVRSGIKEAKTDIANISGKTSNTVHNVVSDIKNALPSLHNWFTTTF